MGAAFLPLRLARQLRGLMERRLELVRFVHRARGLGLTVADVETISGQLAKRPAVKTRVMLPHFGVAIVTRTEIPPTPGLQRLGVVQGYFVMVRCRLRGWVAA